MNKELIPALRFKEFANEWSRIQIQDLIDKKMILSHLDGNHGGLYPRSDEFTSSGVPYISANDFYDGQVDFNTCKHLPEKRASQFKKGIAKDGDVLFAHNATVGPTAILETKLSYVILSTTATYFRCDNKRLLNRYLRLFFETKYFIQQYSRIMAQSTRNQVPITAQRKFSVALPAFNEQQKIASFLSAIDEKIQQLTRIKGLIEQYKKGVMQQLFSEKMRFKDENGKAYPKWEEKRIDEVFVVTRGYVLAVPKMSKILTERTPYPVYSSQTKQNGLVGYYDEFLYENAITWTTDGANAGDVNYRNGRFYCTNVCGVLVSKKGYANQCIAQILNSVSRKYVSYVGNPKLMNNVMAGIKIIVPKSIEEQQKISTFLSNIEAKIESVSAQIAQTQLYKKGLLQQMFV